jgi:vacuolar iron transporter family protein
MASKHELKKYRTNLTDELHSAALYGTLAHVEKDNARKQVFGELAQSERQHAQVRADKLRSNGVGVRG